MGIEIVVAITRVTTKYLNGLIAETSMASICSVTLIEPNSALMLEPTFPAQISAVTNGPKALMMAMPINDGNQGVAPKFSNDGLDCLVKTTPTIKPVRVIIESDFK